MKRYQTYKNSGVDWIEEIPEGWDVLKNKYIFNLKKSQVGKRSNEYDLLSLTLKGVIKRDMENPEGKFPAEFDTYQEVKKGDFIFCLFDVEETPRTVGLSDFDGMITGAYTVFDTKSTPDKKYLYYFYLNLDEKKRLKFLYRGLRNTIPKDSFFSFKTIFPPLPEQTAIAQFLDDKTAKIDQTIAIRQKEIELLKERRQIVIQQAVTKGLDANVPMKDSGVDWIGEIPEHWEVRKLVSLCRLVRGNSPFGKDELLDQGEYIALQYGKTYKVNEVNEEFAFYVNSEFYKNSQVVKYGDVIIVSTSETIEDLGHTVYYRRNELGLLGGEQIMLKPNQEKVNSYFLYFSSKVFSKELRKFATGIKVFRFNINDLKTVSIAVPPISEQEEIAKFIEFNSSKIAKAITLKEQEIEKLKEYKTVLIDQVVMGKVRVS
ncbi:restriction endonuclease subunit S [Amniculibacterium aquaticum]|uniref:restriction endonuclease subunit S n=1 Tax=Amniculibacterium aquaticum TaxID=2479858 RepID=UPI000F5B163F|nr:restriction endonuclease subunit S [Amniculibacterium aquaticum]